MRNDIPQAVPELLTSAEDAADGAAQFGTAIGLLHNTETKIRDDIAAVLAARSNYEQGRMTLDTFFTELNGVAANAKAFVTLARDILKPHLGKQYSQAWDATGFVGSLAIPTRPEELQPLVQSLQGFFTTNPVYEDATLKLTAVDAGTWFQNLSDGRSKIHTQETALDNLQSLRDAKVKKLRKRMRGLIDELEQLMEPLDARWLAFGLNLPGAEERPETPENIKASLINNTTGALSWSITPRATYYRVWRKITGVDAEFVAVGSPTDPNFTINELPPNATVEVVVSALNNGGESALSEAVTLITH